MYNIFKYDNKKNRYQKVKSIQYNHWYKYNTDLYHCRIESEYYNSEYIQKFIYSFIICLFRKHSPYKNCANYA